MMGVPNVLEIAGVLQNYAWGKFGSSSEAAALFESNIKEFVAHQSTPYAELWLGTHPKGPARIKETEEFLSSWLHRHPEIYGKNCDLPFLLKVLSVETALSIQIHPNKREAVELHSKHPHLYPDDNHKPEMAIALTPFEALCGFRPWHEIVKFTKDIEELGEIINQSGKTPFYPGNEEGLLRNWFSALMLSNEDLIRVKCSSWSNKIKADSSISSDETHQLFLRLESQYPGDVGCFCVYFLNYIVLQPGQSIFLESGLPHAYISGDCIECMACSDNVIRAGLTPKFRDVETLCILVKYSFKTPNDVLFVPSTSTSDAFITHYNPPNPEFSVDKIELPSDWDNYNLQSKASSSIIIVIQGTFEIPSEKNLKASRGSTIFIGPNQAVQMRQYVANCPVVIFRAYSP